MKMPIDRLNGAVSHYTTATATVKVNFPNDDVCCAWCKYCRSDEGLGRYWCRLTESMIYLPFLTVGDSCPLEFKEREEQ